ncbi:MAG TPA: hypothetical protein VE783_04145 [Candidatus Limnocylindrales bacterium]|jgi:hypothetical protein|nr:hypothetical protein [Candidatus Limnocylindrales bacterium]
MRKYFYYIFGTLAILFVGFQFIPQMISTSFASSGPQFFSAHMSCSGTGACTIPPGQEIAIPPGKRAFLQYASATASVDGIVPQQAMVRLTVPYFEASNTCSYYEYGLPLTYEGLIGGKSRFTAAQQMNVIITPLEQNCPVQRGLGGYINSTSTSEDAVLELHLSGMVQ